MAFVLEEPLLGGKESRATVRPKWSVWHLFAGILGVAAVALGAYGAHLFRPEDTKFVRVFDNANQYHLFHNLLLAIAPYTRRPNAVGFFCVAGVFAFSGSCYLTALTENMAYGWEHLSADFASCSLGLALCSDAVPQVRKRTKKDQSEFRYNLHYNLERARSSFANLFRLSTILIKRLGIASRPPRT